MEILRKMTNEELVEFMRNCANTNSSEEIISCYATCPIGECIDCIGELLLEAANRMERQTR